MYFLENPKKYIFNKKNLLKHFTNLNLYAKISLSEFDGTLAKW